MNPAFKILSPVVIPPMRRKESRILEPRADRIDAKQFMSMAVDGQPRRVRKVVIKVAV